MNVILILTSLMSQKRHPYQFCYSEIISVLFFITTVSFCLALSRTKWKKCIICPPAGSILSVRCLFLVSVDMVSEVMVSPSALVFFKQTPFYFCHFIYEILSQQIQVLKSEAMKYINSFIAYNRRRWEGSEIVNKHLLHSTQVFCAFTVQDVGTAALKYTTWISLAIAGNSLIIRRSTLMLLSLVEGTTDL